MKLTPREKFMSENPNMEFSEMAKRLKLSYAAIERTYERLQKKRQAANQTAWIGEQHEGHSKP